MNLDRMILIFAGFLSWGVCCCPNSITLTGSSFTAFVGANLFQSASPVSVPWPYL